MTAGKYSGWCLWRLTTSAALMVLVFVAPALLTPALITPAWAHTQEPPKIKALFSGGMTGGRITVKNFQNQPYDFEIVAYTNYQNEADRLPLLALPRNFTLGPKMTRIIYWRVKDIPLKEERIYVCSIGSRKTILENVSSIRSRICTAVDTITKP